MKANFYENCEDEQNIWGSGFFYYAPLLPLPLPPIFLPNLEDWKNGFWRMEQNFMHIARCFTAWNMPEYGFSLTRIFLYKDEILDSVLIQENTRQRKPVFWHVLCIASEYWKLLKSWDKLWIFCFPLKQIETRNICKVQFFTPSILFWEYFYHFSVSRCWVLSRHIFCQLFWFHFQIKIFYSEWQCKRWLGQIQAEGY